MAATNLKDAAKKLAKQGRHGDTELVHMSKGEIRALTVLGEMTINPKTGLREAFKLSSIFKNPVSLAATIAAVALAQPELVGAGAVGAGVAEEAAALGIGDLASAGVSAAGTAAAGAAATGASPLSSAFSTLKSAAGIFGPVASVLQAGSNIGAAKAMSKAASPGAIVNSVPAPTITPPVAMPILGGQQSVGAALASLQAQQLRRGRAATIMTDNATGEKLGA